MSALAVWLVALAAVAATSPWWARGLVQDALVERLSRRLELPVAIGTIELGLRRVDLHDVVIGDPELPIVQIEALQVDLDPSAWWDGRVVVEHVAARGGRVQGSRDALVDLARRLRRAQPERSSERGSGRVRVIPDRVELEEVWFVVDDTAADARVRHAEARVAAVVEPRARRVELALSDVRAELRDQPLVTAAAVRTTLVADREGDGFTPQFPLRVELADFGAPVTEEIAVAGVRGWVEISDARATEVAMALDGGFSDRADDIGADLRLWSVGGRVRRDLSAGRLAVDMAEFELGRVPQVLRRLPIVDSDRATVGGHLAVVFGGGIARVEGDVSLEGLTVDHPVLAKDPVRDIGFDLEFAAELDPKAHRVRLDHARLERQGVVVALSGEIQQPAERRHRRYRMHAKVPRVECQKVLDAVPAQLVPSLQGFVLDGEFDLDVRFEADFADLDQLVLDGRVGIDHCAARQVPADASPERLAGGFTHRVTMRDGQQRTVQLFTGSGSFTPLHAISPYMVKAVLTTEDGGFWRHNGFLPSQFRTAMQRNLAADKVRLGASTITMQMVKNVLLSHQRTLSRKLQELFLTWYVETALSKERIMEIYLNVVEFGPGIYGVTRAARHYFGKHPEELTPPEAAYLALMLPSPVRRHSSWCRGAPSPSMQIKLSRILSIMHDRGKLDDEEYALWKDVPLQFDLGERGSEGACLAQIDALMAAQSGQRALSGLLASGADRASVDADAGELEEAPTSEGAPRMRWQRADPDADSDADAPGRPAMDEAGDGETW